MEGSVHFTQGLPQTSPINPLITELMADYGQNQAQYAARYVFPLIRTARRTGTYFRGDTDNEFRYEPIEWGNNVAATAIDMKLGSSTFTVYPRAYRTSVTNQDAEDFIGPLGLERYVAEKLQKRFLLAHEIKAEAKLRPSTGIQSQAAGTAWNAVGLDPVKNVNDAAVLIGKAVGSMPNRLLVPPALWDSRVMTNAANTAGKQMRDQLGYVIAQTANNVTPEMFGKWVGIERCIVPRTFKAGGNETSTPATSSITSGAYIWGDTTQCYLWYGEDNPGVATSAYGGLFGPQDIQAEGPFFDWQIKGNWYRASSVLGEIEVSAKAAAKITGC